MKLTYFSSNVTILFLPLPGVLLAVDGGGGQQGEPAARRAPVAAPVHDADTVVDGRRHHPLRRVRRGWRQPQEAKVQQQRRGRQQRGRQQQRSRGQHVPSVHLAGAAAEGGGRRSSRQRSR